MTSRKVFLSCVAAFTNICLGLVAPYLIAEAQKKGLSSMYCCLFFPATTFMQLLSCNSFFKQLRTKKITSKGLINFGSVSISIITIALGCLQFVENSLVFFVTAIILRAISGVSICSVCCGCHSLATCRDHTSCSLTLSLMDWFASIAYTIAIPLSGVMFQSVDFYLPFVVFGSISLMVSMFGLPLLTRCDNVPNWNFKPAKILRSPALIAMIIVTFAECSFGFLSVLLTKSILEVIPGSYTTVGALFASVRVSYIVTTALASRVLREVDALTTFISIGHTLKCFSFLLWSSPFLLPHEQTVEKLTAVCVLSGLADGLLKTSSFLILKQEAIIRDFGNNMYTYELVCCLYHFASAFGLTIGAISAGILDTLIGTPKAASVMMAVYIVLAFISPVFIVEGATAVKQLVRGKHLLNPVLSRNRSQFKGVYKSVDVQEAHEVVDDWLSSDRRQASILSIGTAGSTTNGSPFNPDENLLIGQRISLMMMVRPTVSQETFASIGKP